MGWKCRNNTGTTFQLVLAIDPSVILADIDRFTCNILELLSGLNVTNISDCDQSEVTYTEVLNGSTTISGTSSTGTAANLRAGATTNNLGYSVVSTSVSTYGTATEEEASDSKAGLIAGLVVGIVVLSTLPSIQLCSSSSAFTSSRRRREPRPSDPRTTS